MLVVEWIIIPLLSTVLIEVLVACVFFRSRHDLMVVGLAQCVTNPAVNFVLMCCWISGTGNLMVVEVILEVVAVVVEMWIYFKYFSQENKNKAVGLAVVANVVAFGGGLLLWG